MVQKRSDKAHIREGEYECLIDKSGLVVNPPLITRWGKKEVQEYIKFLEQLLPWLD